MLGRMGQGKFSWQRKEQAAEALTAALSAPPEPEKKTVIQQVPQPVDTGHLDPDNPFSYAVVGNFLTKIGADNSYVKRVVELISKPKDRWESVCVKYDCDVLRERVLRSDSAMEKFLCELPQSLLSDIVSVAPQILEQRARATREVEYEKRMSEILAPIKQLSELGVDPIKVKALREDAEAKLRAELGLDLTSGNISPKPVQKAAKISVAPKGAKLSRNTRLARRGLLDGWSSWAMTEEEAKAKAGSRGVAPVKAVCVINGIQFYSQKRPGQTTTGPFLYCRRVLGQTPADWEPTSNHPAFYHANMQSQVIAPSGRHKAIGDLIRKSRQ